MKSKIQALNCQENLTRKSPSRKTEPSSRLAISVATRGHLATTSRSPRDDFTILVATRDNESATTPMN